MELRGVTIEKTALLVVERVELDGGVRPERTRIRERMPGIGEDRPDGRDGRVGAIQAHVEEIGAVLDDLPRRAVVGVVMVSSLLSEKGGAMKNSRAIMPRFKELCGATVCRELKGVGTGKVLCSCEDCVRNAVRAASETLC